MIIKVVYFDEGSAADYIYIAEGGKTDVKTEDMLTETDKQLAEASIKASAGFRILNLLNTSASGGAQVELGKEGNSVISKAITNTILTDYLSLYKSQENTAGNHIVKFSDCAVFPYESSFEYVKMIYPHSIVHALEEEEFEDTSAALKEILEILAHIENTKGYYELITEVNDVKSLLRFNTKAFRNNYSISDLISMKLECHAVEVGSISEKLLTLDAGVLRFESSDSDDKSSNSEDDQIKIYDVILAGIAR